MKTLLAILFSFASQLIAYPQDSSVAFVAYWGVGDAYEFQVTKVKKQWKANELTKTDSSAYVVKFEVIDSTSTAYKIKWSYKTDLGNTYNIPPELLKKFAKYELMEVIYSTSETGTFTGIENWKEISAIMSQLFTDIVETLGEKSDKKDELQKAMEPLISIYSSKEGIEQLVFKELMYFHFPFGMQFSLSQPIEYQDQLPNMLGGAPIKSKAKLFFEEVDFDNSRCVMIQEMVIDPDDTRDIILKFFKKMGLNEKEMKEAMKTAKFDIRDNNRFEYYYYPGIPVKIETLRESIIDIAEEKVKRVDQIIIESVN